MLTDGGTEVSPLNPTTLLKVHECSPPKYLTLDFGAEMIYYNMFPSKLDPEKKTMGILREFGSNPGLVRYSHSLAFLDQRASNNVDGMATLSKGWPILVSK